MPVLDIRTLSMVGRRGCIKISEKAIQLNPNITRPLLDGSILLCYTEEVGKAKKEIKIAIALDPMSRCLITFSARSS